MIGELKMGGKVIGSVTDITITPRPTRHWISVPRKWKRSQRKEWNMYVDGTKPIRKSKGWRKHLRRTRRK